MHTRIIQTPPHVHQEHLDLHLLPPQPVHERALAYRRQPLHQDHAQVPDALLALAAVLRPPPNGQLVARLGHVVEAALAEEARQARDAVQVEAQLREAQFLVVAEVAEGVGRGGREGCVVGLRPVGDFLEFEVAAWFEVSGARFVSGWEGMVEERREGSLHGPL